MVLCSLLGSGFVTFENSNTDVDIGTQVVDAAGPYTISLWIKRTGDDDGTQTHIGGTAGGTNEVGFQMRLVEGDGFVPQFSGFKGTPGDANFGVVADSGIGVDEWYHLAFVWDGSTADGGVQILINGALSGSGRAKAALPKGTSATTNLKLGTNENQRRHHSHVPQLACF